jgi:tetratricopeptide (TPR) repeat protein
VRTHVTLAAALCFAAQGFGQPGPKDARDFMARAKQFSEKKEYDKAIKELDEAIKLDPKFADAYIARSSARLGNGDPLGAIQDLNEAITLDPKNPVPYCIRGNARVRLRFERKAIEDFSEAIRLRPEYAEAHAGRGTARAALKEYGKALADLNEAIRLDPSSGPAYGNRASIYGLQGENERAIKDYTRAIELDPKDPSWYAGRGSAQRMAGDIDKALADLNGAILLDPRNSSYHRERCELLLQEGRSLTKALSDANEAVRLDPKDPLALAQRAAAHSALGDWPETRSDLDEAVRLGPNAADPHIARAIFLACCPEEKYRDEIQACKDAKRACDLTEWKDPYALEALGAATAGVGDFDSAAKWQKKALEDPKYAKDARYARGRLAAYAARIPVRIELPIRDRSDPREFVGRGERYIKAGEFDKALRDFEEAVRLDPKYAKGYVGRGVVRRVLKDEIGAQADLTKAISLDPNDALAHVERGLIRMSRSEWPGALADCEAALKIDPKNAPALTNRAIIRARCADPAYRDAAQALKDARQACDLTGWKAGYPLEGYAAACAAVGDFEQAIKWQTKAGEDADYARVNGEIIKICLDAYEAKKPLVMGVVRKVD